MADLTKEQFEELPDFIKKEYSEVDGVYKNIALMTVKKTANNLDAELKATKTDFANVNEQLNSFEELKKKELQTARDEAMEEAKKNNNTEVILKLEREKLDDERKILKKDRESMEELQVNIAKEKKTVIADRLSQSALPEFSVAFKELIKSRIVVDKATRERTFLNADGSASSLENEEDFLEYLKTDALFKPMMKGSVTTTGSGLANGELDGSASSKNPKDMTGKERMEFKQRDLAGFKRAFKL